MRVAQLAGGSIGLVFSHTAVCSGPESHREQGRLDLSLRDLTVERRGHTSKLAGKLGQLKGVTARLDTRAWKRLGG